LGRMSVVTETGSVIVRDAFGSAPIQKYSSGNLQGQRIDSGNDFKSAETSSIKKAAESFGIGVKDIANAVKGTFSSYDKSVFSEGVPASNAASPFISKAPAASVPVSAPITTPAVTTPVVTPAPTKTEGSPNPFSSVPTTKPKLTMVNKPVESKPATTVPNPFGNAAPAANNKPAPATTPPVVTPELKPESTFVSAPNPFEKNVPKNNFSSNLMSDTPSAIKYSQRDALNSICKSKGITEPDLIVNASQTFNHTGLSSKTAIDQLTSEEAALVIRYANTLPEVRRT
jgi:hypothetical protein